ncbi:MAG: DUF1656 domain-containing protein [Bilophila sp.]
MPHELSVLGVFFSPFLPILLCGIGIGTFVFWLLVRFGVNSFFANPPWVFLALVVIATCLLASVWMDV